MRFVQILFVLASVSACDLATQQAPSKVVVVRAPESQPSLVDLSDSTYLQIKYLDPGYEISLQNFLLQTDQPNAIDSFFTLHASAIDKRKVVYVSKEPRTTQSLGKILKAHGIEKFRFNQLR